ncbi:MAG: hypothetical protein JST00_11705 [Deltaproteobacteria bacterium]|nr:hypothetical protein [Deltaproteobacteria bacterium]
MGGRVITARTERSEPCGGTLVHDFWLLREGEHDPRDYRAFAARRDAPLSISDDLVMHFGASLRWVPTACPALDLAGGHGLNLYDATVIRGEGAAKLERICTAWAQLFGEGPDVIELSHGGREVVGVDGQTEEHVIFVLEVRRDDLLRDLRHLASFASRAATGEHYILHCGI